MPEPVNLRHAARDRWTRIQVDRAELAALDMEPIPPAQPPRIVRKPGKDRSKTGRVGGSPRFPLTRLAGAKPIVSADGDPEPAPAKPKAPRITVPASTREKLARGSASAILLDTEPEWQAGQQVPVTRRGADDDRDTPLLLEIQSLEWFPAREVDAHRAHMLGFPSLGEFAKDRYPQVKGNAQFKVRHLAGDESAVWFAVVLPSLALMATVVELEELVHRCADCGTTWETRPQAHPVGHLIGETADRCKGRIRAPGTPAPGVVAPRWLAPASGFGGDSGKGTTENQSRGMLDAGICVEPFRQERYAKKAEKSIKEGAKLGLEKSETARVVGRKVQHVRAQDNPTRGPRPEPRRQPRRATLREMREEAARPEDLVALAPVDGTYSFDPGVEELPGIREAMDGQVPHFGSGATVSSRPVHGTQGGGPLVTDIEWRRSANGPDRTAEVYKVERLAPLPVPSDT